MARRPDRVVVLGADVEGLAAAALAAQAGASVVVLDEREYVGGAAAARELEGGHRVPGLAHETALVRRALLAPLDLESCGLTWRTEPTPITALGDPASPLEVPLGAPGPEARAALGADAAALGEAAAWFDRLRDWVTQLLDEEPPESESPGATDLFKLGRRAFKLRTLGDRDMLELMRVAPLPAWDWTEEQFADPRLRAALVAPVLSGSCVGPRAAGTTALILLFACARGSEPVGGLAAVTDALEERCRKQGVQLLLGRAARGIRIEGGRALGVVDGEDAFHAADAVISTLAPDHTLLELVAPGTLRTNIEREVQHWRSAGSVAVLHAALSAPPTTASGAALPARFMTAGSPLVMERAADALKYGELPAEPWLDGRVWSASEPGCAPPGAATVSVHVHGVPHALREGWTDDARKKLQSSIEAELERVAPGITSNVLATELLTPVDLESVCGADGGHLHGGDLALDQLWLQRPALALGRYRTPIEGLFLGGASSHPGGPFVGGAGVLAARTALGR